DYDLTKAGRLIANFTLEDLSNWYVRLSRRRFWKGEYSQDKISAYQTLYTCLITIAKLASPIAPYYMEQIYRDLNTVTHKEEFDSVHLTEFPKAKDELIDATLEERMKTAQKITSMILALRKKMNLRVRQPLKKVMIPAVNSHTSELIESIKNIILTETNIKELEVLPEGDTTIIKKVKPDYKKLGPRLGKKMKNIANILESLSQEQIRKFEQNQLLQLNIDAEKVPIHIDEVEIITEDIPGWISATEAPYTVALDLSLTEDLIVEGYIRDLINRVQNIRKESGLEVTDKIRLIIHHHPILERAIQKNYDYICSETLAQELSLTKQLQNDMTEVDIANEFKTFIKVIRIDS
ncbi:MAG TPA: isoleucine--tRNA ligase, partial [Bacteroidales bacterium]|nr:isoleucine--tRNA ligase [Bacteroidales bacterium]